MLKYGFVIFETCLSIGSYWVYHGFGLFLEEINGCSLVFVNCSLGFFVVFIVFPWFLIGFIGFIIMHHARTCFWC